MVKFGFTTADGTRFVNLAITEGNIDRLKDGKPIKVDLAEFGVEGVEVVIFYGKDESEIAAMLRPYIGPETITYDHSRGSNA